MKEGRDLSPEEILQVRNYFGKERRVDDIMNKILSWDKEV